MGIGEIMNGVDLGDIDPLVLIGGRLLWVWFVGSLVYAGGRVLFKQHGWNQWLGKDWLDVLFWPWCAFMDFCWVIRRGLEGLWVHGGVGARIFMFLSSICAAGWLVVWVLAYR